VKCRNKWSVFFLDGGDQRSPTGILSDAVETKAVDGIEVVRVIKINLTMRTTDLLMLNDQAIERQVKFNAGKCQVMKTRVNPPNNTDTVLGCRLSGK